MIKLIIDAARDEIFLMIIDKSNNYSITHENTKNNYENKGQKEYEKFIFWFIYITWLAVKNLKK